MIEWHEFVAKQKEAELAAIIEQENLKNAETRKFVEYCFRDGVIKTTGTDIDKILPPMSMFDRARSQKKSSVIEKLKNFFDKFFGIGK